MGRKLIYAGLIGVLVLTAASYDGLRDQYALMSFKPNAEVADIESRLALTDKARAIFYRSKPQIDGKTAFNTNCHTQPHELELGCYYRSRVFVLRIDHPSLKPEMDVVMAHELLHAAWVELSPHERSQLGTELERVYATISNSELTERMANYARTEPGEQTNELHSILATEFAGLSPKLEQYYARYFKNRQSIVASHAAYQAVFDNRRQELEAELARIRAEKGQLSVLNRRMESLKTSGRIDEYNALVPSQNRLVDQINQRINAYQLGVDEYNALSKSLDSSLITETETVAQ
jgi:hypothetical protein